MGFRQGAYAKIWSIENKGNYSIAGLSVSKKNKETDQYETEFQDNFVRLVGTAHDIARSLEYIPKNGVSIKISSCDVTNKYDAKTGKKFTNFVIFGFENLNNNDNKSTFQKTESKEIVNDNVDDDFDNDSLPFF